MLLVKNIIKYKKIWENASSRDDFSKIGFKKKN